MHLQPHALRALAALLTEQVGAVGNAQPGCLAYRERREKEGLIAGPAEVEIYRPLTD
ncbi:MAG: hypothetical protein ABI812_05970 [Betaproteobacteria bacterium]